jgi:preprotein translocase subunit SecE
LAGILKKTQKFTEDVQVELRRVTWPDREQLRNATAVVLVFVLILAAVIGLMDTVFAGVVRFIVRTFGA